MSTTGPADSTYSSNPVPVASGGLGSGDSPIDPALVQQTKNEIRGLVQEITQLSQADIAPAQFYEQFLQRVVAALACHGGAVWTVEAENALRLDYQVNLPRETLIDDPVAQRRHAKLLGNVLASGQPTLVPPHSGSTDGAEAGNPTDDLLILACLRSEQQTVGVVEIFQRAGGGPTTQRGYLRFLAQMSEVASDYFKNRRLRQLDNRQSLWEQLEGFLRAVHQSLDSRATAFTMANESRRLIQCDRVSVALRRGRKQEILAVSGLDTIDRRAAEIRLLGRLAGVVTAAGKPLWYGGDNRDLPPQIDEPLQAYLDQSHAKLVGVLPLYPPEEEQQNASKKGRRREALGALIVEQLSSNRLGEGMTERAEIVAQHGSSAMANAAEHESLFLMPLWRALGKAQWVVRARMLPRTLSVAVAIGLTIFGLAVFPADFDLAAKGKLRPSVRRDVFAHLDGVVVEVPVNHEDLVVEGQNLARMTNHGLELEVANLVGRKRTTQERIRALQRSQFDQRLTIEQQNQIAGELLELGQSLESIERELALLREQEQQLVVRSPMDGQVVTWNVGDTILRRPVQRGQALMTIVDPSSDWELELYMPEKRMGHLSASLERTRESLPVTFMLASHPGKEFSGRVAEIHRVAEVRGEEGNTVLLRVKIDQDQLPELRSETTVTAQVGCGKRPLGMVLFHEVFETIQTKILFWF